MERLRRFGNIPVDYHVLESVFSDYRYPRNKISALERNGSLMRLKRGLYVVSPDLSGKLVSSELAANHLYGPSYVSMESALRFYGLIPESVHPIRSMTVKRSRVFINAVGRFEYISCPDSWYSVGVDQAINDQVTILIASPEKALCDLIAYTPGLRPRFVNSLRVFLEEDLRLDMEVFYRMNREIIAECSNSGKKRNELKNLLKIVEG